MDDESLFFDPNDEEHDVDVATFSLFSESNRLMRSAPSFDEEELEGVRLPQHFEPENTFPIYACARACVCMCKYTRTAISTQQNDVITKYKYLSYNGVMYDSLRTT